MRGLFREFAVIRARMEDARTLASYQAYQTVRIYLMTMNKKGRMPDFRAVMAKRSENTLDAQTDPKMARALMEMLAARAGTKTKPIDRRRIVKGLTSGE